MGETELNILGDDGGGAGPSFLARLFGNRRLLAFVGVAIVGLLIMVGVLTRSHGNKPAEEKVYPMAQLYENLSDAQVSRVTQELSFLKIKFQTVKKGKLSSVSVPENKIDFSLQKLAEKGLPLGEAPGFELFDKDDGLGATEFDKRIKYVRAVSGEIERTIMRLNQVKTAKVQIVIPEKKLFSINQDPVKASVMLELQPGKKLSREQIYGIIALTSHSVDGLQPKDVTVIDIQGNMLSLGVVEQAYREELAAGNRPLEHFKLPEPAVEATPVANQPKVVKLPPADAASISPQQMGADWLKAKEAFEAHLKRKAEDNLALLLPPESFKVEVDAEFYAIEKNVPEIKKISTSIMIDSSDTRIFLDDIEKKKIFSAVADVLGYQKERDQIVLRRVDFRKGVIRPAGTAAVPAAKAIKNPIRWMAWLPLLKYIPWRIAVGVVGGLALVVFLARRIRQRRAAQAQLPEDDEISDDPGASEPVPVVAAELTLQEVLQQYQPDVTALQKLAGEQPDALARLLQVWLDDDTQQLEVA